jgi:transcriptional regulator with XRE-family HTH domain
LESYCIGLKLRSLRIQKRLTLSRLAAETGLSTALLSKLETDRMIPTLPTLATISRVYGVGLGYFFSEPDRHKLSITRKAQLQGKARGPEPPRTVPLNLDTSGLNVQIMEFRPGAPSTTLPTGKEVVGVIYVLEGKLHIDAGGAHDVLETGDCACIDSEMPLAWSAADKTSCRVLAVFAPLKQPETKPEPH